MSTAARATKSSVHGNPGSPVGPKRRVLLAMGFVSPDRLTGIVRYARAAGWVVDSSLIAFHAMERDREYLDSSRYDGVLTLLSRAAPWLPELVRAFKVPVVDMWADYPEEKYPRVLLDHASIGRMGAEHLLSRGFRDLLFYTHVSEGKAAARREAFRDAVLASGARYYEVIWNPHSEPTGAEDRRVLLARRLAEMPLPLAVMASNDAIASEVLEATEIAGLRVPTRVAVLGVDNDPLVTELAAVPLSSIDSGREEAGYQAAALLDRLMAGEAPPERPILIGAGRVVTRLSTDVLAVRDGDVLSAIQFIQEHFREPISVEQVAANGLVSRRYLQDRFLTDVGRTISQTILWQRVDHAKGLLAETAVKIQAVAEQSGFGTGERMSKIFRKLLGVTPGEFRRHHVGAAGQPRVPLTSRRPGPLAE